MTKKVLGINAEYQRMVLKGMEAEIAPLYAEAREFRARIDARLEALKDAVPSLSSEAEFNEHRALVRKLGLHNRSCRVQ